MLLLCCKCAIAQLPESVRLPNGWMLSPAGKSLPLGDLPLNMVVSPNGKFVAVTNNGQSIQSIQLFDAKKETLLDQAEVSKSWYGLAWSSNSNYLYASGGHDNKILRYTVTSKKLVLQDSLVLAKPWPVRVGPAGLALDDAQNKLYVVTREDSSLYIFNTISKQVEAKTSLGSEAYGCLLSPDKKTLYISVWGGDRIAIADAATGTVTKTIAVGDNPNDMAISRNGRYLLVCNANDNSVSVIDLQAGLVIEALNTALYPNAPSGSTANALILSADEKTLYVANADNNCLAVFDFSNPGFSKSLGFIPTGWYPTNVKVVGKKLWVANGKGFTSKANPLGPTPLKPRSAARHLGDTAALARDQYIGGLFKGTLSIIELPKPQQLAQYSAQVYKNTPYKKEQETSDQYLAQNPFGNQMPIRHVFYIIKENRTYDQVLADVPGGNGDTSLLLFGEKITPNQHKLVKGFVLLDNFYCDGEVSADGHNWSMGAYATDYLEKTWPSSYGGRGGTYGGEGERKVANNKAGFIWDLCKRGGVTYRTYGEFADNGKANIPSLVGHFCPYYTGYNTGVRDTVRFYQWRREFDSLVVVGKVPQFNSVRFGNDHTDGQRLGSPTPFAHVADNDLAVGMFLEHLSKSQIWKESVVFIVEDDAQNGPDHVDAHRTTAYVAGPHVKRGFIDHTMYSTSSMLRTMELILGLPPMTQYDAAAMPMWNCFTAKPDMRPFASLPANLDLNAKNNRQGYWQRLSETFDLSVEDAAPDLEFSKVIWHAVKGDDVPFPGPRRAAFVRVKDAKDDDD